ncbi:sortase [Allosaccharopolyspora coralli]|uniref:Sortase n=1 Tax=Allosaccharopolyspora coralli TaxID=2665642 RepID=A0A5Q3Q2I7_9PSEU|nr:class F sortase [Allosaccharopolyspora coralli]QGK68781.1 sortase [Allosaccharopolyspora coralli]
MTERNTERPRRRGRLAAVLAGAVGLAGAVALVAGIAVSGGGEPTAQQPPAPLPATTDSGAPVQPVFEPAGQPPGTVQLPQGGTATLVRKELEPTGTLPVPDGVGQATWWGAGLDAPEGATVLAGHVNWKGEIGPFDELWDAAPGGTVSVRDEQGTDFTYRVSEIVTVTKEELPAQAAELFSQGGEHRLVLVTCGGRFVGGDEGYTDNRIVIATPV